MFTVSCPGGQSYQGEVCINIALDLPRSVASLVFQIAIGAKNNFFSYWVGESCKFKINRHFNFFKHLPRLLNIFAI